MFLITIKTFSKFTFHFPFVPSKYTTKSHNIISKKICFILLVAMLFGCNLSPVPHNIEQKHKESRTVVPALNKVVQAGDIIFRLSNATILNGKVNFSVMAAELSCSDFSHASIIYKITEDGVIIANIDVLGMELIFLKDWYLDGTKNVVVKRLKPKYQCYLPLVLNELKKLIDKDVLYDDKFIINNDKYYCTEMVDHCFRSAGLPLDYLIRIKDLPGFNLLHVVAGKLAGINVNNKIAIAGNQHIGIFSSKYLCTVVDLRF